MPTGILTVKLGWSYGLTLPDSTLTPESWHKRWRPYVIAEYAGSQLSSEALTCTPALGDISWVAWHRPFRFDLPAGMAKEEELILSLFVSSCDDPKFGAQCGPGRMFLGLVKVNPHLIGSGTQKLDVQEGTGGMSLEISYTEKETLPLTARQSWSVRGRKGRDLNVVDHCDLFYVEKKESGRSYGLEIVDVQPQGCGNIASSLSLHSGIQHPFIAPLMFAFISPDTDSQLELLSPLGSGGYLSHHVQRQRRLSIASASFYAAELICLLEYLHGKNIVVGSLRIENILLDSSGHLSFCKPSLFALEPSKAGDCILPGFSPYPSPEVLLNSTEPSRAGDWWNLGVILYEILIGVPPFYHNDHSERKQRIIHNDPPLPVALPSDLKDILASLLEKDPTRRLGAHGVHGVKAHPFLAGWKWDECIQRKLEPPFKPHDAAMVFWREPHTYEVKVMQHLGGEWGKLDEFMMEVMGSVRSAGGSGNAISKTNKDAQQEEWDLIWESAKGKLYFSNLSTNQKVTAKREGEEEQEAAMQKETTTPRTVSECPTEQQLEEALAAALQAGYNSHLFSQLLNYSPNLNFRFVDSNDSLTCKPTTPLEYAVEHERPDLVHLFLDHGADADFTTTKPSREGPALIKAVLQNSPDLVESLVKRTTDRVARTRALALAVEQQDTALVTILLAHGVRCDFEDSDQPLPPNPFYWDYDSNLSRTISLEDLTPPLVRAARVGNLSLVQLLLEHGADPNVAYHDLGGRREGGEVRDSKIPAMFSCGRAVQIAMEMGYHEVVRVLVDAGADVDLAQPVWCVPGHVCLPVPRAAYLEIVNGLMGVAKGRK
ncbi:kinase-like domain-containing protein [Aspergillus karnatakaensis]|uniref:putative protein kinase n=1 Tax=Aspergillus karnatakaensis TaxID=1810916 RepID=UPI003CCDF721